MASSNRARCRVFPFTAIVGQERLKRALLANAVNPLAGGVLVRGEKGTAKSTAVRGLAEVLPVEEFVSGCAFNCSPDAPACPGCLAVADRGGEPSVERRRPPLVDLPLGATEDRVCGGMDMERAIREARAAFLPGVLARAHRGFLYVDEVNLLPDHLVDVILDAAAEGANAVEREGLSFSHPSRFVLVGTMNPEEGSLRPQLTDRFGLCVDLRGLDEPEERMEILRRRLRFEESPEECLADAFEEQRALEARIDRARRILPSVRLGADLLRLACELAEEANAAGHRAEIAIRETARAFAALDMRDSVREADVREAAVLALAHRERTAPPPPEEREQDPPPPPPQEPEDENQDENQEREQAASPAEGHEGEDETEAESGGDSNEGQDQSEQDGAPSETVFPVGDPFRVRDLRLRRDRLPRTGSGKRARTRTSSKAGRYVRCRADDHPQDLAFDATVRAAAPYQRCRSRQGVALVVETPDLRRKVREKRVGSCIVFAVDASGSMGAGKRMVEAKGAVLSLLLDAYQKRDSVGFVAFKGERAEVLLHPTSSVEAAYRELEDLPTGGKTPLAEGLHAAYQLLDTQLRRNPGTFPVLVVISDGRANASATGGKPLEEAMLMAEAIAEDGRIRTIVVDVERKGIMAFGLARDLAERMGAHHYHVDELHARDLVRLAGGDVL
jgi:magnesium chelatase subunit D